MEEHEPPNEISYFLHNFAFLFLKCVSHISRDVTDIQMTSVDHLGTMSADGLQSSFCFNSLKIDDDVVQLMFVIMTWPPRVFKPVFYRLIFFILFAKLMSSSSCLLLFQWAWKKTKAPFSRKNNPKLISDRSSCLFKFLSFVFLLQGLAEFATRSQQSSLHFFVASNLRPSISYKFRVVAFARDNISFSWPDEPNSIYRLPGKRDRNKDRDIDSHSDRETETASYCHG